MLILFVFCFFVLRGNWDFVWGQTVLVLIQQWGKKWGLRCVMAGWHDVKKPVLQNLFCLSFAVAAANCWLSTFVSASMFSCRVLLRALGLWVQSGSCASRISTADVNHSIRVDWHFHGYAWILWLNIEEGAPVVSRSWLTSILVGTCAGASNT